MNVQYITDANGMTTGVYIPIEFWNELRKKYDGLDEVNTDIPQWQIDETRRRVQLLDQDPNRAIPSDKVFDEIEKEL